MAAKRLSLPTFPLTLIVALAIWMSRGALTPASQQTRGPRYGLLPSPLWLAVAAVLVWIAIRIAASSAGPLARRVGIAGLAALLLLPWLPIPVPPAFLVWTGPLATWLWILIAVALAAPSLWRHAPASVEPIAADPRRAPVLAASIAAAAYLIGAWQISPVLPAGDEPHYLVIAQSLLTDHSLKIENTHRRGDYHAYYNGPLKPDYLRRGADGEIYSVHAPGLPVLVLPVFAALGYPGVVAFLALCSAAATALVWLLAFRATGDASASWFGWAAVAFSAPFFFHAFAVYPDAPAAALVSAGLLTMIDGPRASNGRLLLTGIALSLLPWLHTRYALLAAVLGGLILARQRFDGGLFRRAAAFLAVPLLVAACWLGFFFVIYGTPDPRIAYGGVSQTSLSNIPRGIIGLLIDQQYGLLPVVPVFACAALGLWTMLRRATRTAVELLLVVVPYALAVASYGMWWGGYSSTARFLVPIVPVCAIPAAYWFHTRGRLPRVLGIGILAIGMLATFTMAAVDRGALVLNFRDGASRLLRYLSPAVDLTTGVPSVFQTDPGIALLHALVWIAALSFAIAAAVWVARRAGAASTATVTVAAGLAAAVAAMASLTIVWRSNHAIPLTPGRGVPIFLQHDDPDRSAIAVRLSPFQRVPMQELAARLTLADVVPASRDRDDVFARLMHVPAATYAIEATLSGEGAGRITLTVDRELGTAWTWDLAGAHGVWRREFTLPVTAPSLAIDGDTAARLAISRLTLRPVTVPGSRERAAESEPDHVARYGPALVALMDGRAYMERGGTWVGGGASADLVIAPDNRSSIALFVRNPPVDNHVTIEGSGWRRELAMKAGEERTVDIPVDRARGAARVRVTAERGARPTDFEHGSTDARLLGCWIETR